MLEPGEHLTIPELEAAVAEALLEAGKLQRENEELRRLLHACGISEHDVAVILGALLRPRDVQHPTQGGEGTADGTGNHGRV